MVSEVKGIGPTTKRVAPATQRSAGESGEGGVGGELYFRQSRRQSGGARPGLSALAGLFVQENPSKWRTI